MGDAADGATSRDPLALLRHDLCNPINQILGYSQLLEEDFSVEQPLVAADLRKIQTAAEAMLAMLRNRLTHDLWLDPGQARSGDASDGIADPEALVGPGPVTAIAVAEHAPPGHAPIARTGRVLAVDDDSCNLDLLAQRLTRQGHLVSTAQDGQAALEKLGQQPFDLVLLDVMMPRLDGYATLAALKADERLRPIPVIMISALGELESVVRCIEAGAEDYLAKPFNPTLLRARVGASLDKKWAHDQQVALYDQLLQSQQQLDRSLIEASRRMAALDPELRQDARVAPLLEAFSSMSGAVSRRETDLRSTLSELKIEINRNHLGAHVSTIVADPSFSSLSERARAMRARRQSRGESP
ncbi:MAG: response regulator [Cyanobacteriota bacterium]|nr:response regulator [Cyanobacteriota bacterium]